MKKVFCAVIGAVLLLANNGSCLGGGGVNSPGTVATICTRAAQAAQTVQGVLQVLVANGVEAVRAQKLAAAVTIGAISIEAACAAAQGAPAHTTDMPPPAGG